MTKILKSSLLLMGAALVFSACSDDRDSNPTLVQPESFVLNTPAFATQDIDLKSSSSVNLTWSQPNYGGFPVAASYTVQLSATDEWTVSYAQELADDSGNTKCNYYVVDAAYTSCEAAIGASEVAKALQVLNKYEEGNVPDSQDLYVRLIAEAKGADPIYSNVVSLKVKPYYIELKAAAPVLWYFVGSGFANADWSTDKVGQGLIPLLPMPDAEFDANGNGTLTYTGFFPGGCQFKFIRDLGSWDNQMNYTNVDSPDTNIISDLDGDNHNIGINNDGYYTVEMNTATSKIKITKEDITPGVLDLLTMAGEWQGWDTTTNPMTALTSVIENHSWMADVTFPANGGVKFTDGSWTVNWGSTTFPIGKGVQDGKDIPYKAGTYRVYFNDISGIYYFMEQ